eukprot:8633795-Alexandrium_andersonii.AAC.1
MILEHARRGRSQILAEVSAQPRAVMTLAAKSKLSQLVVPEAGETRAAVTPQAGDGASPSPPAT